MAVTTARTITARLDWGAPCANDIHGRAGHAAVTMLARRGNAFGLDIRGAEGGTGTVAGTIGASVALELHAAGRLRRRDVRHGALHIDLASG